MTLRDQRAFAICLGGCDPGSQSCCPRSARDDGLTDPDNGPDAVRHARSPADYRGCAAERRCGPLFGGQWRELTVIVRRIHRQDGGHVWAVVTQRAGCGGSSPRGDLDQMPIRTRCSPTSTSRGGSERRGESVDHVDHGCVALQ